MNNRILFACAFIFFLISQSLDAYSEDFTSGINVFSTKFFKILAKESEDNIVISPLSAVIVLSMAIIGLHNGKSEAINELRISLWNSSVLNEYRQFIIDLRESKKIELYLANKIFVQNEFPIRKEFVNIARHTFNLSVELIDFSNTSASAKKINNWCGKETRNKITKIIEPGNLLNTQLMMISAVYFKGKWARPFHRQLANRQFYLFKNNSVAVPMMHNKINNSGLTLEGAAKYIELPYEADDPQNQISMFIIVPTLHNTIENIYHKLNEIDFTKLNNLIAEIDFYMPKFTIESELDIIPTLKEIGFSAMFQNDADYSNLSPSSDLRIKKMIQKVFLKVDEKGSEAAVITRATFGLRSFSEIVVNKPFFAAIVKKSSGTPLLWARINDPRI